MKLYEITEEIMNFAFNAEEKLEMAQTEEEFKLIDAELYQQFQDLHINFEDKIENIAKLDRNLRADIDALKEEEKKIITKT